MDCKRDARIERICPVDPFGGENGVGGVDGTVGVDGIAGREAPIALSSIENVVKLSAAEKGWTLLAIAGAVPLPLTGNTSEKLPACVLGRTGILPDGDDMPQPVRVPSWLVGRAANPLLVMVEKGISGSTNGTPWSCITGVAFQLFGVAGAAFQLALVAKLFWGRTVPSNP